MLDAVRAAGIELPVLCFLNGHPPFNSCMACLVKDCATNRLIPACSSPAAEGMQIDTGCEMAVTARRNALELLLDEHRGDCRAPCSRACPAGLNIPELLRNLVESKRNSAQLAALESLVFPEILARICPAPCERVCRRGQLDQSVKIRTLLFDLMQSAAPLSPSQTASDGPRVLIVGAGPAGLTAVRELRRRGYACTLMDAQALPGGGLRYGVAPEQLPPEILDAAIARILNSGVETRFGQALDAEQLPNSMLQEFAVIGLALGSMTPEQAGTLGLPADKKGLRLNRQTLTVTDGIFAAPASRQHRAVYAVSAGRRLADSIHSHFTGCPAFPTEQFDSRLGPLSREEVTRMATCNSSITSATEAVAPTPLTPATTAAEAARCLHCDCRATENCKLRKWATRLQAQQHHDPDSPRLPVEWIADHPELVYEPGKCIRCGRCVKISEAAGDRGLAFAGRGMETRITPALGASMQEALTRSVAECITACPTGALAWKRPAAVAEKKSV